MTATSKAAPRWLGGEGDPATDHRLTIEQLRAALPTEAREYEGEEIAPDFVVPLDEDGELRLARIRWGAFESTVAVFDSKGRVRSRVHLRQRAYDVGLLDVIGDDRPEVVVDLIEGMGMSVRPRAWALYRLDDRGKLVRTTKIALDYGWGAKCTRYDFVNEVRLPEKGRIEVVNVFLRDPDDTGDAASAHGIANPAASYQLRWNAKQRKFRRKPLDPETSDPERGGCPHPNGPPPGDPLAGP